MIKRLLLLNGLSIIGVVCAHAAQWVYLSMFWWVDRYRSVPVPNYDFFGTPSYYGVVILQKIGVFAVPAFLFTSGFFVAYTSRSQSGSILKRLWVRLRSLLIPYVIWSLIIFLIEYIDGKIYTPFEYARRLLLFETASAYWYIFVLCQFYLLSPLLVPLAKRQAQALLIGAGFVLVSFIGLLYLGFYSELSGMNMLMVERLINLIPTRSFLRWGFFFVAGMISSFQLRSFKDLIAKYKQGFFITTVVMLPLAIIETELVFQLTGLDWRGGIFTIAGSLYAISFILWFLAGDGMGARFSKIIYKLGRFSLGIFLIHRIVLEFIARATQKYVPQLMAYPVFFHLILVVGALGMPVLAIIGLARSPMRQYSSYLFG
jgi:peptidoglycan/LPS O-acetylase OafA/YrhL